MSNNGGDRWASRPVLGALLRCAVVIVPFAVALLVAVLLTRTLPAADGWPARVAWWVAVLGGSTLAMVLTDRAARRTLPLAVLLDLSLVFPGTAPSRLRTARTTSVRELEKRLVALRAEGASGRPIDAAETLVTLVGILGLHDRRTRGHSERVRAFTDLLTTELGLDEDARVRVRWAALVHDIGKLTVPGGVLNGGRDLSDDDWAALRRHPDEGRRLAAGLVPWLGEWGRAIDEHHERWDGSGYPHGLAGAEIGYGARIVTVADAFDTMTSARSYSKARTAAAAREELARCAGSHFDPTVVRAFLNLSVARLSWVLGPVTWLAQLPFVVAADRAGRSVKAGAATAAVAALVAAGVLSGPGAAYQHAVVRPAVLAAPAAPQALPFVADPPVTAPKTLHAPVARTPVVRTPVVRTPVGAPVRGSTSSGAATSGAPAPAAPVPTRPVRPAPVPPAPPAPAPPAPAPPAPVPPAPPAPVPPAPVPPAPPAPAPVPPVPAPPAPVPAPPAPVPVPVPAPPPVPTGNGTQGNGQGPGNNGNGSGSNGNGGGPATPHGNGAGNNGNGTGANGNANDHGGVAGGGGHHHPHG